MYAYSVIMFAVAIAFLVLGVQIYRGNTGLIHSYHQSRVKDRHGYARAFGRVMFWMGAVLLLSGGTALTGTEDQMAWISVALLMAGLAVGVALLLRVQKKYNGGLF